MCRTWNRSLVIQTKWSIMKKKRHKKHTNFSPINGETDNAFIQDMDFIVIHFALSGTLIYKPDLKKNWDCVFRGTQGHLYLAQDSQSGLFD